MYWLPTFVDAQPVLEGLLGEGDVCLVMGAGNVDALGAARWCGERVRPVAAASRSTRSRVSRPCERAGRPSVFRAPDSVAC